MFVKAYLDTQGWDYRVIWDTAEEFLQYVILTDYVTPSWAKHQAKPE